MNNDTLKDKVNLEDPRSSGATCAEASEALFKLVEAAGAHPEKVAPSRKSITDEASERAEDIGHQQSRLGPEVVPKAAIPRPDIECSKDQPANLVNARPIGFLSHLKPTVDWLLNHIAPLLVLLTLALVKKALILWILAIVAKPVIELLYRSCPEKLKSRFLRTLPKGLKESTLLRELNEGAEQGLPFVLFGLYLFCAPFAIIWIAADWLCECFRSDQAVAEPADSMVFTQNRRTNREHSENNFYHSRSFSIVIFAFFALGIPAFFSYALYEHLGVARNVQNAECEPLAVRLSTIRAAATSLPAQQLPQYPEPSAKVPFGVTEPTIITSYFGYWTSVSQMGLKQTAANVFFVQFYLVGLASVLCVLFFRAWFSFPLNFLSDEHDLEFTEYGIKRKSINSWFLSVVTLNRWCLAYGPDSLGWSDVKSVRRLEEGFTKLCPLPETTFKKESLSYKLLNKVAALVDGLSHRPNNGNFIVISTGASAGDFGRNIKLDLCTLSRKQRAKLFYSIRSWAPHVATTKEIEQEMLGSTVLRDTRYTQLWFDMLSSKDVLKLEHALSPGESLKAGQYFVIDRLSGGGQATTYLATSRSGEKCVLKEFILAANHSSGALIASAREFEAEVSLLSQLNHPGIVRLIDFFTESGRVYVVLECIEGQSLKQMVQERGPLPDADALKIANSVCDVLEYLHSCNPPIVHRDVTPENILIKPDGTITLIDFSLAVKQDQRQTTNSCAKQCFTPPEQFRDEVSVQSDIYALGATMHYLLTGLQPKPITTSYPKEKCGTVSTEVNDIVARATQLELYQRYESVGWLKLDINKVLAQSTVMRRPALEP